MGTSGGVWGLERGYCLMIGGETDVVKRLDPIFKALAPGVGDDSAHARPREARPAPRSTGYLHCGPSGAGHFVKMVHNGIEYGLMAAYAEGLNILQHANVGKRDARVDAETTPLRNPEHYQYDFNLPDITEVWRRGSVSRRGCSISRRRRSSPIPTLEKFARPRVRLGRRPLDARRRPTTKACRPTCSTASLFERFASREDDFQNHVLSAMRFGFGGHVEKT